MKIAIVGSGVIGLSYGWVLSRVHEVVHLVRPERAAFYAQGFTIRVRDERKGHPSGTFMYRPTLVTSPEDVHADVALVTTSALHLPKLTETLQALDGRMEIVMMMNHWDLPGALEGVLDPRHYLIGFPSQVGGGREGHMISVTVFPRGTVLGHSGPDQTARINRLSKMFTDARLHVELQQDMTSWLKVHCLQQSLAAGPILQAGSLNHLLNDRAAMRRMVQAYREGLHVAQAEGANTNQTEIGRLFSLPTWLTVFALKYLLSRPLVSEMVQRHMAHGLAEWIFGYNHIRRSAKKHGIGTPALDSYMSVLSGESRAR